MDCWLHFRVKFRIEGAQPNQNPCRQAATAKKRESFLRETGLVCRNSLNWYQLRKI